MRDTVLLIVGFAFLSEALVGEGSFRLIDVAGWALVFVGMLFIFALMTWAKSRWAESLAFGAGLTVLVLVSDLVSGRGFDWIYLALTLITATGGWFAVLSLAAWFTRLRAAER
jgi:hypothetical protein